MLSLAFVPSLALALMLGAQEAPPAQPRGTALDPQEAVCERLLARAAQDPRLELERVEIPARESVIVQGFFTVPENRDTGEGREIRIGMVIIPARDKDRKEDPVFFLHGGPGAGAIGFFRRQINGWIRQQRDVVLIDQRGTGSSNRLTVPTPGRDSDLQTYFESFYQPEYYLKALPELKQRADLSQYTTPHSIDDFEEIRRALGYGPVNLRGGSYGTRAALVWMRMYPESIRTATLQGIQPIAYRNPLPHARGAQQSIDLIFEEVRKNPEYAEAFPALEAKFLETLARLEKEPAQVLVSHPDTGEDQAIVLDRNAFAEGVRLQLYSIPSNRQLPLLLLRAYEGDYRGIAEAAMNSNRGVAGNIAWGMLMCVTASEDLHRIDAAEIGPACEGTFLGETRVRQQLSVAKIWPYGNVPKDFAEPVSVDVPTLLWSGTHDPSTTPEWGAEAARHLPNSLHVVIPSGHGVFGRAVERLDRGFLDSGTVDGLDLTEVRQLKLPPLVLPPKE